LALKNATPVERAGLTDVLEIGMEMRWIRVRVRPMARPANPLGARSSVDPRMTSRNELDLQARSSNSACRPLGRRADCWRVLLVEA